MSSTVISWLLYSFYFTLLRSLYSLAFSLLIISSNKVSVISWWTSALAVTLSMSITAKLSALSAMRAFSMASSALKRSFGISIILVLFRAACYSFDSHCKIFQSNYRPPRFWFESCIITVPLNMWSSSMISYLPIVIVVLELPMSTKATIRGEVRRCRAWTYSLA